MTTDIDFVIRVAWIRFDQTESVLTNFIFLRLETSLGARARQKEPVSSSSSSSGTFRPRSESPHHSSLTTGHQQGKVQQQSRSLDERRARISRQRNSSFSSLSLTAGGESSLGQQYQPGAPPTITVRRPSMTCGFQPGGNSERNLSAKLTL